MLNFRAIVILQIFSQVKNIPIYDNFTFVKEFYTSYEGVQPCSFIGLKILSSEVFWKMP